MSVFYVVGNGPSLTKSILAKIPDNRWIGMNSAYKHWDQTGKYPKYYACLDPVVVKSHAKAIARLVDSGKIEKFFLHDAILNVLPGLDQLDNVTFLSAFVRDEGKSIPLSGLGMYKQTTGALAARYCIEQGENNLCLIGIDCNYVEVIEEAAKLDNYELKVTRSVKKNPNYFFDDYQSEGDKYQVPNPRVHSGNLHLQSFVALRDDIAYYGVDVSIVVGSNMSLLSKYNIFKTEDIRKQLSLRHIECLAIPMTSRELDTTLDNLSLWCDPKLQPSINGDLTGTKLHIFMDCPPDQAISRKIQQRLDTLPELRAYFDGVEITFFAFPESINYYKKGLSGDPKDYCTKSGPNIFFLSVMKQCQQYAYTLHIESDCSPLRAGWLDAAENEVIYSGGSAWILGANYTGPSNLYTAYGIHINGNAIYATGNLLFQEYLDGDFLVLLQDVIDGGLYHMAYDTLYSFLALGNANLARKRTGIDIRKYLSKYRVIDLIVNLSGRIETSDFSLVDLSHLLANNPNTFIGHGRVFQVKVPEFLHSFPSTYSTNPLAVNELSFSHAWSGDRKFTSTYRGYGELQLDAVAEGQSIFVFFSNIDRMKMAGGASEIVLSFDDLAGFDSVEIVVSDGLSKPDTLASTVNKTNGRINVIAELSPDHDKAVKVLGLHFKIQNTCQPGRRSLQGLRGLQRVKNMQPVKLRVEEVVYGAMQAIGSWERFIETGLAKGNNQRIKSDLFYTNFSSTVFSLLDVTSIKDGGFHFKAAYNTELDDRKSEKLATLFLEGTLNPAIRKIRFELLNNRSISSCKLRICRDGLTKWEYVDFDLVDSLEIANPFSELHHGFRLEVLSLDSSANCGNFELSCQIVPVDLSHSLSPRMAELTIGTTCSAEKVTDSRRICPRLLMIDSTPVGHASATGQLKKTFLGDWPSESFMQVWENATQIPTLHILGLDQTIENSRQFPMTADALLERCKDFAPDVIYFRPVDTEPLFQVAEKLAGVLQKPMVIHIMDDWPERLRHADVDKHQRLDAALRRLISYADAHLSISDKMSETYKKRYKVSWQPLANGVDLNAFPRKDWSKRPALSKDAPFVIRYMGGLAEDMNFDSVADIANAVSALQPRLPVCLEVFTMPWYHEKAKRLFGDLPGITVNDLVSEDRYFQCLCGADASVIAYNFDEASFRYVGLSLANKMPECLASGTPLLAYGPENMATISSVKKAECAKVVLHRDQKQLSDAIESLVSDFEHCRQLSDKARRYVAQNLTQEKVQQSFLDVIDRTAHGGYKSEKFDLKTANLLFREEKYLPSIEIYLELYKDFPLKIYEDNALMSARCLGWSDITTIEDLRRKVLQ